jgi:hypothetical protein
MVGKFVAAGIAVLGLALSGCNSGSGVTAVAAGDLIGKWLFTKADIHTEMYVVSDGKVITDTKRDTTMDVTTYGYYVELKDSSKFTANIPPIGLGKGSAAPAALPAITGTWSVTGNTLSMITGTGMYTDTLLAEVAITGASGTFTFASVSESKEGTYSSKYVNSWKVAANKAQ